MSIKKNFAYNLVLTISQFVFPLVTFPYASRVLGADGIGVTSFIESFSRYFLIFAVMGIPIHGMREIAKFRKEKEKTNEIFQEIFSIQFFFTVIATVIYFSSLFFLKDLQQYFELYLMGGFLILSNIFSLEWVFQGLENFKFITLRTVLLRVITIVLLFLLVQNRQDYIWYFFLLVFSSAANGIINFYYARKFFHFNITTSVTRLKEHFKPILLTGSYLMAISIYSLLTIIILGLISTNESVGYYTAASKFNRIALGLFSALSTILIPRLTYHAARGELTDYKKIIDISLNFVLAFGFPISISILLMAPELIHIFAGPGYEQAIICVQIMSPIVLITGFAQIFGPQILIPFSKDRQNIIAVVIGAIASIFLNAILITFYNEKGASITTITIECIVSIITFYYASRVMKIELPVKKILRNLIFGFPYILFALVSRHLLNFDYQVLLLFVCLSLIYFIGIQWFIEKNIQLILASNK